ncbi:MAG: TSUP family transporter, partial [Deltaproteobacteria bacterium]
AGLPPHIALGTNKGQSVWGSGAATAAFWRAGSLDRKRARFTFPLGFVGSWLGAEAVLHVPSATLRPLVLVLLVAVAAFLTFRGNTPARAEPLAGPQADLRAAVLAITVGAYDGFFGPGTGTFLIIGYVLLLGSSMTRASGDAKVVNFASNLAAVIRFGLRGTVLWQIALPMAVGQFAGGWLGAHLAVKGGDKVVRRVVLGVVAALVVKLARDLLVR